MMLIQCVSKKLPTFKLSVTLSNLNRFSKSLHCLKAYEICYKTHSTLPASLDMLLHYLGKLKIQIFCRYSAHMEENAKMHFKCTDFNSSTRVTVYSDCTYVLFIKILSLSLNTMLIIDKNCCDVCCDEFPMPQIDRKGKQVKE